MLLCLDLLHYNRSVSNIFLESRIYNDKGSFAILIVQIPDCAALQPHNQSRLPLLRQASHLIFNPLLENILLRILFTVNAEATRLKILQRNSRFYDFSVPHVLWIKNGAKQIFLILNDSG